MSNNWRLEDWRLECSNCGELRHFGVTLKIDNKIQMICLGCIYDERIWRKLGRKYSSPFMKEVLNQLSKSDKHV